MTSRAAAGLVASAAALCACGSQPIPMAAVEGTTAMIAIPGHFDVGYGRRWAQNPGAPAPTFSSTNYLEDLQRGEMIFTLVDKVTLLPTPNGKLPVRLITRVAVDAASTHAYSGTLEHTQAIALVDIPPNLVSTIGGSLDLGIKVERFRRDATGTFQLVPQSNLSPWYGWGSVDGGSGEQTIPITIVDAPNPPGVPEGTQYTPIEGWDVSAGSVRAGFLFSTQLEMTVPLPEFRIQLPANVTSPPYAWGMEVTYPAKRMQVIGVRALRADPSGAIVTWNAEPEVAPVGPCTPPQTGTLKIQVVDPDEKWDASNSSRRARGVGVIFQLVNQGDSSCQVRITASEVSVASIKGYTLNGVLQAPPPQFALVTQDLN